MVERGERVGEGRYGNEKEKGRTHDGEGFFPLAGSDDELAFKGPLKERRDSS